MTNEQAIDMLQRDKKQMFIMMREMGFDDYVIIDKAEYLDMAISALIKQMEVEE